MRFLGIFVCLITILEAKLLPTPFFMNLQRVGRDSTLTHFGKKLFYDCYGIAMVKPRGTNSTLLIVSDPDWCRLIYTRVYEQQQDFEYLRQFGGYGTASDKFIVPKGLCIDRTIYSSNSDIYGIYVADSRNNRVSKLKYSIAQDKILVDGILVSGLSNPTDVACASQSEGGAYIVIAEKDTHRIRLYQRSASGVISLIQIYGIRGSGVGEFFEPQGVAICVATDSIGGYFIYVTDTGNRRVVCLRYKSSEGITWKGAYRTMENAHFLSVTASQYYCVYVTDVTQNKIWVFTPGLGELLYTYGNASLLNGPKDICIDWDRIGLTERWTANTGIQYFEIIPEIREFYPEPQNFDATEDSVKINFKVYETKHYLTMTIPDAGVTLFENQEFAPGSYSLWWDGRDDAGKVVLPGDYAIKIYCGSHCVGTATVTVKGTQVSGVLSTDEHWTEEGEPYVLTGDVQIATSGRLTIDPGVKVMPAGNYMIKLPAATPKNSIIAQGSPTDKILFTPHRKLYPEPDQVQKGSWKGIYFYGYFLSGPYDDTLLLTHCIVEAAGSNGDPAIFAKDYGQVILQHCEIKKSAGFGYYEPDTVRTIRGLSMTRVSECAFVENDSLPLRVAFSSIGEVHDNEFTDNGVQAIEVVASKRSDGGTLGNQGVPYHMMVQRYFESGYCRDFTLEIADESPFIIEPGTILLFEDSTALKCGTGTASNWRARIIACGTSTDSIVFSAMDTDLGWVGITIYNRFGDDTSHFEYCQFLHGGQKDIYTSGYGKACLSIRHSPTIVKQCTFAHSKSNGFDCFYDPVTNFDLVPKITDNYFVNIDSCPLVIYPNWIRNCYDNSFSENDFEYICVKAGASVASIDSSFEIRDQGIPYAINGSITLYNNNNPVVAYVDSNVTVLFQTGLFTLQTNCGLMARHATFALYDDLSEGRIVFDRSDPDSSQLISCYVERFDSTAVLCKSASPTFKHTIFDNNDIGIEVQKVNQWPLPVIDSCIFTLNNTGIRFRNVANDQPQLLNNDFNGNRCCIQNYSTSYVVPAEDNWYGDMSGPWDPSSGSPDYNPAGRGDSIGDYVDYRPWLSQPVHQMCITVVMPNGNETLHCGHDTIILWSRNPSITPTYQELYYTTDFPVGGASEAFWEFIDTVSIDDTVYTWQVPFVVSNRCRVAVKLCYEESSRERRIRGRDEHASENNTGSSAKNGHLIATMKHSHAFTPSPLEKEKRQHTSITTSDLYTKRGRSAGYTSVDISDSNFTITDITPPAPTHILSAEKSGLHLHLTWSKVMTDTTGTSDSLGYYVIYRNTTPSFIPGSSDSIGSAVNPETTFTDNNVLNSSQSYYYLVKVADWNKNYSRKSNMAFALYKFFNENNDKGDRNWVSLPWYNEYSTASDITDDLSPHGDPLNKLTDLTDSQIYENWTYHPVMGWYGTNFTITSGCGYEMVATTDSSVFIVGANEPDSSIFLNHNPEGSCRNWVSMPYNVHYTTVSDITDEYSSAGQAIEKLTNLRDDQMYEDWIWDPDFEEWYGTNFTIQAGRGCEIVAMKDTCWNPTEYTNESGEGRRSKRKSGVIMQIGLDIISDRTPAWQQSEDGYVPVDLQSHKKITPAKSQKTDNDNLKKGNMGKESEKERISHVVRAHATVRQFKDLIFSAYRTNNPHDVLTQASIGCGIVIKDTLASLYFDAGNFSEAWHHNEEVMFIIEAVKESKGYFIAIKLELDSLVDIQDINLRTMRFQSIPSPEVSEDFLRWSEIEHHDVIGYSIYDNDRRLNDRIINDPVYSTVSNTGTLRLRPILAGGVETVYSSSEVARIDMQIVDQLPEFYGFSSSPNPSVSIIHIQYSLPERTHVDIIVYDVAGRQVKALVSSVKEPGYYSVSWHSCDEKGRKVPAGIYFIRCTTEKFQSEQKVLLLK